MSVIQTVPTRTAADLSADLGVAPERVLMDPPPGTATEADLIAWNERWDRSGLCELVDGILVEKPMGLPEAYLAVELAFLIRLYLQSNPVGFLAGADAPIRFAPGRVRLPDVSFVSWVRRPERTVPRNPVSDLVPNLAVEVLSPSNTRREMADKRAEYFAAGVELVWQIDPDTRSAEVYTSPTAVAAVPPGGALDGGAVLPGLSIPLARLFAGLDPPPAP